MEIVFRISRIIAAIILIACISALGAIAGGLVGAVVAPVKGFRFMFAAPKHYTEERPADKI